MDALCRLSVPGWDMLLNGHCITAVNFYKPSGEGVSHIVVAPDPSRSDGASNAVRPQVAARNNITCTPPRVHVCMLAGLPSHGGRVSVQKSAADAHNERVIVHPVLVPAGGVKPGAGSHSTIGPHQSSLMWSK